MTESNPVQVTLSDDGIKIINAQNAANSANKDVKDLYDPNMMSVIEKQGTTVRFAGETSRYKILLQRAKDAGIDSTALESAYTKLNVFMSTVIGDGTEASDVDRKKYAEALDIFNNQMALMQNAVNADFNNKMAENSQAVSSAALAVSSADVRISEENVKSSQAVIVANAAAEKADVAVGTATVNSQAVTDLKGGSSLTIAQLENGLQTKVSTDDFKSEITQLGNTIKLAVSDNANMVPYSGYWQGVTPKGWELVSWGDPNGKLGLYKHSFYHNGQDNTMVVASSSKEGKSVSSWRIPVERNTTYTFQYKGFASGNVDHTTVYFLGRSYGNSSDYDNADIHVLTNSVKMSPSHIDTYTCTFTTGTSEDEGYIRFDNGGTTNGQEGSIFLAEIKMEKGSKATPYVRDGAASEITEMNDDINLRVSKNDVVNQINVSTEGITIDGKFISITGKTHIDDATIDSAAIIGLTADKIQAGEITATIKIHAPIVEGGHFYGAAITASSFDTPNDTFTVDGNGNITATSLSLIGNKNCVYNSELLGDGAGWIKNAGYIDWATSHSGTYGMVFNGTSGPNDWNNFGQSKPMKLKQSNVQAYSLSVWHIDWTSTQGMQYVVTLAFLDANKNRIEVGSRGATYTNADGKSHDWQLLTIENAMPPAGTQYVVIQYWAHNGTGYAGFSQPMISQSTHYQGYTADTGNVISSGEVILNKNGKLTTSYDGIVQDSDTHYHAWNMDSGDLSIGKGYITSDGWGTRTINGNVSKRYNTKGTFSSSYIKFTSSTGGRTYMDADLISLSTGGVNDTFVVNSNGVHIKGQGMEISGGLDASTTWGQFGAVRVGNGSGSNWISSMTNDWIYFTQAIQSKGNLETIVAANLSSSSQLSKKKTVAMVKPNGNVVANTNLATYLYKDETNTHGLHMSPIIDDVNDQRSYYIAPEIMALDGETIDINKSVFYGWSAIQALQRANERLQIRLRKLEIEGKAING